MEQAPVEQHLLFDHTAYIEGIAHIGQVALIELIMDRDPNEPRQLHDVLQLPNEEVDSSPRLFEE